jgi:hypothetical protein
VIFFFSSYCFDCGKFALIWIYSLVSFDYEPGVRSFESDEAKEAAHLHHYSPDLEAQQQALDAQLDVLIAMRENVAYSKKEYLR